MTEKSIRDQLWDAADPTGTQRALLEAAAHLGRTPGWLHLFGGSLEASWVQLADLGGKQAALMESMEAAVTLLVPRGWAVMHMDSAAMKAAVLAVAEGRVDEAD